MSKSLGNHIRLLASPEDMYGAVMSVPDQAMGQFFRLVTRWTPAEIADLEQGLGEGRLHPRDVKVKLAREIVSIYHHPAEAAAAEENFKRVFQQGVLPEEIPAFEFQPGQTVLELLVASGMVSSRGEGRRLCAQKGVRLDGDILMDANARIAHGGVLQVGKRKFIRLSDKQI